MSTVLRGIHLCACQDLDLGAYPGFNDDRMDVVSSQEGSLLSLDLSCSDVTDSGLINLKDCKNLQTLNLNYCDQISDHGLEYISGMFSFSTTPPFHILLSYVEFLSFSYQMSLSRTNYVCVCACMCFP